MTWDTFKNLISVFGVSGALLIAFIYSLHKGWTRLGREDTDRIKSWERDRAEMIERYNEMKAEKDMWRDLAVKNAFTVERATDIAHTAMNAKGASTKNIQGKD